MSRCGTPGRRRRALGPIPGGYQFAAAPIGDPVHTLGSGRHLDIENPLILAGNPASLLKQDPQLRIGMGCADMGQNRALTTVFTHNLNRHRTRGSAHLPHVRHRPNLPA